MVSGPVSDPVPRMVADAEEAALKWFVQILCRKLRNEDDHSHFNNHYLDPHSQGVEPGQAVPAIRTEGVWAVVAGALREAGLPFPAEYTEQLNGVRQ